MCVCRSSWVHIDWLENVAQRRSANERPAGRTRRAQYVDDPASLSLSLSPGLRIPTGAIRDSRDWMVSKKKVFVTRNLVAEANFYSILCSLSLCVMTRVCGFVVLERERVCVPCDRASCVFFKILLILPYALANPFDPLRVPFHLRWSARSSSSSSTVVVVSRCTSECKRAPTI